MSATALEPKPQRGPVSREACQLPCPFCGHVGLFVVDSRVVASAGEVRRRRECVQCHRRVTTYEAIEVRQTVRHPRAGGGALEAFDQVRLEASIVAVLSKHSRAFGDVSAFIESCLRRMEGEVDASTLAEWVEAWLWPRDPCAALRYVSRRPGFHLRDWLAVARTPRATVEARTR